MDPNETLVRMVHAAIEGESAELLEAAEDLAEWLAKGGFPPTHEALAALMERYESRAFVKRLTQP